MSINNRECSGEALRLTSVVSRVAVCRLITLRIRKRESKCRIYSVQNEAELRVIGGFTFFSLIEFFKFNPLCLHTVGHSFLHCHCISGAVCSEDLIEICTVSCMLLISCDIESVIYCSILLVGII